MIVLFEESETRFVGLGIGVLKDSKSCIVKEELNDAFELQMVYPITGKLYNELKLNRIIFAKPNPYNDYQPFRIGNISKPINGLVTIDAFHISYDMNGLPVAPVNGKTVKDTLDKIQNGCIIKHNFKLYTDKNDTKTFKTTNYYNMRALLLGSEGSVLEKYEGEMYFNKFDVYFLKQRGSNKGAQVRYAKNLKDITHEISYDRLYNGVYPYYHQESSSQSTNTTQDGFKQVYIVGTKPYQDGWLSYTKDGEPYHPIDESPVQVATEGSFYQKVYCWNSTTQRYVEKVYNETVTLIDQVGNLINSTDTPSWIYIDWSGLPTIICKAGVDGYFKAVTESEWTYHKKDEVIFENSIKEVATNLMIYYSEVIPTTSTSEIEETTTITHIELDDRIIYLDTDAAKEMKFDRILPLDLTSEFQEPPTKDQLEAKAKEYIEKNKIGKYKYNTMVSFVDLSTTTEGASYENMESIELGDVVKVVYDDLGVDIDLRVISTQYDVILDRYEKIELGEKPEKISGESIQNGDNVSSLTNDVGYTDITTVNKLIAKTVTADYIKALNAEFSKAQIEELTTARLKVSGLIEATQFELDTLIAKMLIADNAKIKETLEAGNIKVAGDITIQKGEINIVSAAEDGRSIVFRVDREGNVTANSVKITGGELNINDTFTVTPEGLLSAQGAQISGDVQITSGSIQIGSKFSVTEDGIMTASGASITGEIIAETGEIAGFSIDHDSFGKFMKSTIDGNTVLISPDYSLRIDSVSDHWSFLAGLTSSTSDNITTYSAKFKVSKDGYLYATGAHISGDVEITSGSIEIKNNGVTTFQVTNVGHMLARDVEITGGQLSIGSNFIVNQNGEVIANSITVNGGQFHIQTQGSSTQFDVLSDGTLTATNANISGRIVANSGYIGSETSGFTITENSIFNGFDSISSSALSGGVYLGTDGIRIGQNASKGRVTLKSNFSIYMSSYSYIDITDSSNPDDDYSGGMFTLEASSSKGYDRVYIFTPTDQYHSPLYDAKDIIATIPAGETSVKFSLTQSRYFRVNRTSGGTTQDVDTGMYLYLQTLAGFVVNQYGDVVMRDVMINGGSITIKNSAGTQTFSVSEDGKLTATGAEISGSVNITSGQITISNSGGTQTFSVTDQGVVTANSGTIGGFTLTASSLYNGRNSFDSNNNGVYIGTDGISFKYYNSTISKYVTTKIKDRINSDYIIGKQIIGDILYAGSSYVMSWAPSTGTVPGVVSSMKVYSQRVTNVGSDSWATIIVRSPGWDTFGIRKVLHAVATYASSNHDPSILGGDHGAPFIHIEQSDYDSSTYTYDTITVYVANDTASTRDIDVIIIGEGDTVS